MKKENLNREKKIIFIIFHLFISNITLLGIFFFFVIAEIKMPSGKVDLPLIEDNRDGTVRVQYDPKEEGVHELVILYNGVPVEGKIH